jgi:hypothetical protein
MQSFILQPLVYLPSFYATMAVFRGWSSEEVIDRVKSEYWSTLLTLWTFWTPLVVFNFKFVPLHRQSVVFAVTSFSWNVLLSFISNRGTDDWGDK